MEDAGWQLWRPVCGADFEGGGEVVSRWMQGVLALKAGDIVKMNRSPRCAEEGSRKSMMTQLHSMVSSSSRLVQLQNVATFRRPAEEWTRMLSLSDCFSPLCWGREEGS